MTTTTRPGGTTPGATRPRSCFDCGKPSGPYSTCDACEIRALGYPDEQIEDTTDRSTQSLHPLADGSPHRLEAWAAGARDHR